MKDNSKKTIVYFSKNIFYDNCFESIAQLIDSSKYNGNNIEEVLSSLTNSGLIEKLDIEEREADFRVKIIIGNVKANIYIAKNGRVKLEELIKDNDELKDLCNFDEKFKSFDDF